MATEITFLTKLTLVQDMTEAEAREAVMAHMPEVIGDYVIPEYDGDEYDPSSIDSTDVEITFPGDES